MHLRRGSNSLNSDKGRTRDFLKGGGILSTHLDLKTYCKPYIWLIPGGLNPVAPTATNLISSSSNLSTNSSSSFQRLNACSTHCLINQWKIKKWKKEMWKFIREIKLNFFMKKVQKSYYKIEPYIPLYINYQHTFNQRYPLKRFVCIFMLLWKNYVFPLIFNYAKILRIASYIVWHSL